MLLPFAHFHVQHSHKAEAGEVSGALVSVWVLNSAAPLDYPGVQLDRDRCVRIYRGEELPSGLTDFQCQRHTWQWHIQDRLRHNAPSLNTRGPILPLKPEQEDEANRIRAAYDRGSPGYLLNNPTGSGKTPISVVAADKICDENSDILVITKNDMIPAWRNTIDRFCSTPHRWVVINPERMWMLFRHPRQKMADIPWVDRAQMMAVDGVSELLWHTVVIDEAQMLATVDSQRARLVRRLERQFTVYATATPATYPEETSYVSDLIAYAAGVAPPEDIEEDYPDWLRRRGLRLVRSEETGRWMHSNNRADVTLLVDLLYERGVGASRSVEELGLPTQVRKLMPLELSANGRRLYNEAWLDFLDEFGTRDINSIEPSMPVSQALRSVQKASLLKLPVLAEAIADWAKDGYQVTVPMFFLRSVHELARLTADALKRRGLNDKVVTMTGEDNRTLSGAGHANVRERKRRAFQFGHALVAIFNGHEGINLQAGEQDVDGHGRVATDTPRVTVLGDVLTGGKRVLQAEGRAQRNGQSALAVYAYAEGTAEEVWLQRVFHSAANTRALSKDHRDAENLVDLAAQLQSFVPDPAIVG